MPGKRKGLDRTTLGGSEPFGHYLTSGDIARMLHVDLKTIHNWVTQGHIRGSRTKGRHLRFERNRVVRFMREYGYPLPPQLGEPAPRVLVEDSLRGSWVAALRKAARVVEAKGLFSCSLLLGSEPCEVAIVGLEHALPQAVDFCRSVAEWEATAGVALIGIGSKNQSRSAFLAAGGTAVLPAPKASDVRALIQYLIGADVRYPATAEFSVEPPARRSNH